ncbi:MAG: RsmB/NOP family class I SAM-dependent RNA methyltransferase, partial [Nitrospirae bacterium]
YRDLIPEFDAFIKALERPHPSHLRVNTLKTTDKQLKERLSRYGCLLKPLSLDNAYSFYNLSTPGATLEYFLGHYHLQGLSSMLPPVVLEPREGELILDMCASPGSKTSQIAQLTANRAVIFANELNRKRLSILKFQLERLGVTSTIITSYQAQNFPTKMPDGSPLRFDRVLLDAPCTGEGRYRRIMRKDELKKMQEHSEKASQRMAVYQKQMILRGFDLLKRGGVLVYSTCTYSPYENEAVVDFLLKNRPEAELEPFSIKGIRLVEGVNYWKGMAFSRELLNTGRLYPHYVDSWGFFIARIRKN